MLETIVVRTKHNEVSFRKCKPHGNCVIGSKNEDIEKLISQGQNPKYLIRETPQKKITLAPYFLQTFPVSIQLFREFIDETNYSPLVEKLSEGSIFQNSSWTSEKGLSWFNDLTSKKRLSNNTPVTRIFYDDAKSFAEWFGSYLTNLPLTARLPTEAEFEVAASYDLNSSELKKREFSWTNKKDALKQLRKMSGLCSIDELPHEVNGFKGLCGVIWQWCEDFYANNYLDIISSQDPLLSEKHEYHSLRGGSFLFDERSWRPTYRSCPSGNYSSYGFRLALTFQK